MPSVKARNQALTVTLASEYFSEIKEIWRGVAGTYKIIPFCTPLLDNPQCLVIGINHSTFQPNVSLEDDEIAAEYASGLPIRNTYVSDHHNFAVRLRKVCAAAGVEVDNRWVGTNRCAIQTGPKSKVDELRQHPLFANAQVRMDILLKALVEEIRPRNVLLVGKYAAELYYPNAQRSGTTFRDLAPRPLHKGTTLLPLPHPSYPRNQHMATNILRSDYVHATERTAP